jgi:hypothetical protein
MRLAWNAVLRTAGTLFFGAAISLACSADDEFTRATGGNGGTAGSSGTAGKSGAAGSGGTDGSGGTLGRGGTGGSAGSTSGGSNGTGGSSGTAGAAGTGGSAGVDGGGSSGTGGSAGTATGGTAGSSGGTSGSGGSAGTAGTAGSGGAMNCRWGVAGACPAGQYCNALGCETGTCMPMPAEGSTKNPVCGCDGLIYWNASVAANRGMSVRATGECAPARTCQGIASLECPGNVAVCNMKIVGSPTCIGVDLGGACWVLPTSCPNDPGIGPRTRACSATTCKSECELIRAEQPWYDDNSCPT